MFQSELEIDFLAQQKVTADNAEKMYNLFNNYYQNNVISIVGINASGKTTLLKVAVLIFSTHYSELLDEFERNDNIYIVRNRAGITAENLSRILKRNDIKKSEAYQSGFLEGTVPMYEAYMDLKKVLLKTETED